MTKKRKAAAAVLGVLLVLNLCFIWGNSLMSRESSHGMSMGVLELLPPFVRQLFPDVESLEHVLRKMAHFSEFACLGALSCGQLALWRKLSLHPVLHVLSAGFAAAAIDETIQVFSNRGSQLQDVWLDFSGFAVGLALVLALAWLWGKGRGACRR